MAELQKERNRVQGERDIEVGKNIELRLRVADYDALVRENEMLRTRYPRWITWVAVPVAAVVGGVVVFGVSRF